MLLPSDRGSSGRDLSPRFELFLRSYGQIQPWPEGTSSSPPLNPTVFSCPAYYSNSLNLVAPHPARSKGLRLPVWLSPYGRISSGKGQGRCSPWPRDPVTDRLFL